MRNFESLGNNSEFGFVLQNAGVTQSSLFKWTLIDDFTHLIAAIDAEFEGLYESANLVPRFATMVRDIKFGLCFHTEAKIGVDNGRYVFIDNIDDRMEVIERERQKFRYLANNFLQTLRVEKKIYVLRSGIEIPAVVAEMILRSLRRVGHCSLIVMKQADDEHPAGTVRILSDGVYEGSVAYISKDPGLQDIQHVGWLETCQKAWEMHTALYGLATEQS
ncbi:hypothetical protein MCX33_18765 [Methylorubrum extorquens]|nr:hypothetical protein [Methylorubrum extorquens]